MKNIEPFHLCLHQPNWNKMPDGVIHSQFYEEYDNLTLPLLQFYKAMVGLRLTFSIDPRHVMTQCVKNAIFVTGKGLPVFI